MKFISYTLLLILTVALLGFGGYHFFNNMVAERASEEAGQQLESPEQKEAVKGVVDDNPVLRDFVEEGADVEPGSAVFQTKEEAVKVVVEQFNPVELMELRKKAEDGLDQTEQEAIISKLEENLTEEQLEAVKAIAYQELYQ